MAGPNELQNEFSWSKSRDAMFNVCLRGYYYHYYGSWNGWRRDAPPDLRELYIMKNLQTVSTWRGVVVHRIAQEIVGRLREGRPLPVEQALTMAGDIMQRDFEDSRTGRYRRRPNRICGLAEHYYDQAVSADTLRETMVAVEGCVRRVYGTGSYQTMLQRGPASVLEVEKLESMNMSGHKVWVSPDAIARTATDGLMIVDWKTGGSASSETTRLQLAIYGLYATRTYGADPDQLTGVEENLQLGEAHVHALKEWVLEEAQQYIDDSIRKMQALLYDRERNVALLRSFPKTDNLATCMGCNFRRACARG
jgi:hypothetical protein